MDFHCRVKVEFSPARPSLTLPLHVFYLRRKCHTWKKTAIDCLDPQFINQKIKILLHFKLMITSLLISL